MRARLLSVHGSTPAADSTTTCCALQRRRWDGVAKLDLQAADAGAQEAVVGRIQLPAGMYNGETVFVPR